VYDDVGTFITPRRVHLNGMSTNNILADLESTIDEMAFHALAEAGEIRQLEANGGRLEIPDYEPRTAEIRGLSDGQMSYLIRNHNWLLVTGETPYVFKKFDDF